MQIQTMHPPQPAAASPEPQRRSMFISAEGKHLGFTFLLVSSLFLLWGFCNGMIDVMDKHFQEELHLTLTQSANVQWAHYLGYFLMALPAGWLATRLGYKGGIIAGLLMVAAGGLWFIPATHIAKFWAFLVGVCFIAAGLTFLETIANPYTTVLGPKQFAAARINLAQSCNGIGWVLGPLAGTIFFYGKDEAGKSTGSTMLWIPYAGVAVVVIILAVIFSFASVPDIKTEDDYHLDDPNANASTSRSIWSHPHFWMAVVAQFFYVAAQAGIFAFFINYMTSQTPAIPDGLAKLLKDSANYITSHTPALPGAFASLLKTSWIETDRNGVLRFSNAFGSILASAGFVCFLLGRFIGAMLLKKTSPHRLLGIYGFLNALVCLLIAFKLGWLSVFCVFLAYFFMSIMFPTIFALGIFGLGARAKKASSYIVMAIMGGALLPKLMGSVADHFDVSRSFVVPLFCFVVVGIYGLCWPKLSKA